MTRNVNTSKGPSRIHPFSRKRTDRARQKTPFQGKDKPRAIDDVYEYAPSKVRRAKVTLSLDHHEMEGRRYDSDDEIDLSGLGQDAMEKLRAKLTRDVSEADADADTRVDSEDDEDIDSEDAFEESDKDDFAGSGFVHKCVQPGSRRKRSSNVGRHVVKEVNLNEDSDGDSHSASEDGDDDEDTDGQDSGEFFDVLDIFDGRTDVEGDENSLPKADKVLQDVRMNVAVEDERGQRGTENANVGTNEDESDEEKGEDTEGDDNDDDDDEGNELCVSASDAEDPSPEALADLERFISNLEPAASHKRKPDEVEKSGIIKRRRIADCTEAGEENVFGVRGSSALKLDDLLAPLASSTSLSALKRLTKPLTSSSTKTKTLSAPLPQRVQERLDREAAYEQTKEEMSKWSTTMKRIKEAEHLSFPLQAEKPGRVSNLELVAKFTPSTELESAVDKLLKSAQLRDEDITKTESLKMAHLSVEEVAARRAELRTMRELAFRADRKARRIAKIKSKTYRRIRKKQRERLDRADGDEGLDEEDEEARLKAEVQRARERATLRHRTTGKWAKAMKGREGLDQDQRQAIGEMLERGEKLRRRIYGENSDDERSRDSESDEEEQDEEAIKRGAFEELAALRAENDADLSQLKCKSVFNMKFMREAAARRSREADAQAEEIQKEMEFEIDREEDDDDDGADDGAPKDVAAVQRTGGRLSFRPGMAPGVLRPIGSLASDTSSITLQSADLLQNTPAPDPTPPPSASVLAPPMPTTSPAARLNPWLVPTASSGPSRKRNEMRVHKGADAPTKSSNKLKKQTKKQQDEKVRARDDAVVEIDANSVLVIPDPPTSDASHKRGKQKAQESTPNASSDPTNAARVYDEDGGDASDAASEIEAQERAVEAKKAGKSVRAFEQRDLVALAFAGDNVVQAFEEAKRRETEADAPREVDTTLPGWGTWGGTGTQKRPPKPHLVKSVPGIIPTARADHAKPHVIISEKRDKKASKYLVRDLPYPYTSRAQFERRMATPLGSEWNTRVGFQRGTMPRVVKKMGTVIDPLEKLF